MRKTIFLAGLIGFFLLLIVVVTSQRQSTAEIAFKTELSSQSVIPDVSPSAIQKSTYRGPLDDCLLAKTLYLRDISMQTECTENYVHFFPIENLKLSQIEERSTSNLRVGSFNLFHLGDNQAPMKSFSVIASIINQWDILAAQEIMPLGVDVSRDNQALGDLLRLATPEKPIPFPIENWTVIVPGYLRLLIELQKLDSSWSLILQSFPEGESSGGEMAGFFYRSSVVQLKEWDYCPLTSSISLVDSKPLQNLACLTQLTPEVKKLTSRTAFAAYFQSGQFDFIGLSLHSRFRPASEVSDIEEQKQQLCRGFASPDKCKVSQRHAGRYYEVFAVAEQIPVMKEKAHDADVIFMGDFNLEITETSMSIWEAALKPAPFLRPFQLAPSTLGVKHSKMVSSYDHFILDTKLTSECDMESVKIFDFMNVAKIKSNRAAEDIARATQPDELLSLAEEKRMGLNSLVKVQTDAAGSVIRVLTEKEKEDIFASIPIRLENMKKNSYSMMLELISDHTPIEMNCIKSLADDD